MEYFQEVHLPVPNSSSNHQHGIQGATRCSKRCILRKSSITPQSQAYFSATVPRMLFWIHASLRCLLQELKQSFQFFHFPRFPIAHDLLFFSQNLFAFRLLIEIILLRFRFRSSKSRMSPFLLPFACSCPLVLIRDSNKWYSNYTSKLGKQRSVIGHQLSKRFILIQIQIKASNT